MTDESHRDLGVEIRPVDWLLSETTGGSHEAVHALIGLLDAARELASKAELPKKIATVRFLKALVDAEVDVLGLDREDSRRCDECGWVGSSDDVNATDYGDGEVILECPACHTLSELGEVIMSFKLGSR